MPEEKIDKNKRTLLVAKVTELHQTLRLVAVCATIISLALIARSAYLKIHEPTWLTVLKLMLWGAPPTGAVLWAYQLLMRRFRKYMSRDHQRIPKLEAQLDPNRQSSGLRGTEATKGRLMKVQNLWIIVLAALACFSATESGFSADVFGQVEYRYEFSGACTGGTLYFYRLFYVSQRPDVARIVVGKGEETASVAGKLVDALNSTILNYPGAGKARSDRGTLIIPDLEPLYATAGSEAGLGIPPPVNSLSGWYDAANDALNLSWRNPPDEPADLRIVPGANGFDEIPVAGNSIHFSALGFSRGLTAHELFFRVGGSVISSVVAERRYIPSGAASIRIGRCIQEDAVDIPFTGNLMPNWTFWSQPEATPGIIPEQRTKPDAPSSSDVNTADDKIYYQGLRTHSLKGAGGTERSFIGLPSGHNFRVRIRLNTLAADPAAEWALSICAATSTEGNGPLSTQQLAGKAPLPDGTRGPDAGLMALYHGSAWKGVPPGPPGSAPPGQDGSVPPGPPGSGQAVTTGGRWVERRSDETASDNKIGDITLPPGADAITVWLRLEGSGDVSGVGMDWVALEDLTCSERLQQMPPPGR